MTQTHRQNNSNYKAVASGEQNDTQQWQREGPRPGKNERKKVLCRPKWCAAERERLKDTEMRATVYLAGRLKLQNGDEGRAGKGIKSLSTGLCNRLLHYMKPCLIQAYTVDGQR